MLLTAIIPTPSTQSLTSQLLFGLEPSNGIFERPIAAVFNAEKSHPSSIVKAPPPLNTAMTEPPDAVVVNVTFSSLVVPPRVDGKLLFPQPPRAIVQSFSSRYEPSAPACPPRFGKPVVGPIVNFSNFIRPVRTSPTP